MSPLQKHTQIIFLAILISLSIFLSLTLLVIYGKPSAVLINFDSYVYHAIFTIGNPRLTNLMKYITFSGDAQTITFLCVVLCLAKPRAGVPISLFTGVSALLNHSIKGMILRPRPPAWEHLVAVQGYSFPSGHSCSSLVFYFIVGYTINHLDFKHPALRRLGYLFYICPFLIGISRIYLRVHYPSDVLAGWSLGIFVFCVFLLYKNRI